MKDREEITEGRTEEMQQGWKQRIHKYKNESGYQKSLYMTFMVSLLVPVVISVIAFIIYINYSLDKKEEQRMSNMLQSVAQSIEMKLNEVQEIGNMFYMSEDVFDEAECLNNPNLYRYYSDLDRREMELAYSRTFTNMIYTSTQPIRSVVFFPINKMSWTGFYIGCNASELKEFPYSGYHKEEWFTEAIENPTKTIVYKVHQPDYFKDGDEDYVYSCVNAIRDMNNNRVIGVVKVDVDTYTLQESLDAGDEERQGFVLSKQDEIFMHSKTLHGENELKSRFYQKDTVALSGTDVELTYVSSKGVFYRGFAAIILFTLLLVVVSGWLAFEVYRRRMQETIDDMRIITDVVDQAGNGNLDNRIRVTSQNEMKEIADSVNKMMDALQEYINEKYLLVIQNQKAEYRALQSQINPHFLYNTLNGFVALNRMGEKKILEKSIIRLAHLFRYVCKAQEIVDVESEFRFLEQYLELEKLKYEERLNYEIWLDDACRKLPLPKLLLQPIVENSIVHGMGISGDVITIRIHAARQAINGIGEFYVIQVSDNGRGFEMKESDDGKAHIGIENVQMRAELFTKNTICCMTSKPGDGTKTTFVFSIESGQEEE